MDKEIWKDIEKYEGLYQVSNLGNIKRLETYIKQYNGYNYSYRKYKQCYLKKYIKNNYYQVALYKNGKSKYYNVHRLVAKAFIPNPNSYPCVNHKDENKLNNCINNLEWCTQKYNINYGNRNNLVRQKLKNKPKSLKHKLKLSESAKLRHKKEKGLI